MKPTAKIDWSRARSLLAAMRSHVRRRLAGRILLGKELLEIKKREGFQGSGGDRRSNAHIEHLKSCNRTWNKLCIEGLGITRPTADRYIRRFEAAANFAKTLPKAANILLAPSAELTGDEIETLAEFVEELVDAMTRAELEIDLGTKREKVPEPVTTSTPASYSQENLEAEAVIFFASIPRKLVVLKEAIAPLRDYSKYEYFIKKLPLDDGRPGKPSLRGIKEGLEAVLAVALSPIMADLEEAIEEKMRKAATSSTPKRVKKSASKPPKRTGKAHQTTARK